MEADYVEQVQYKNTHSNSTEKQADTYLNLHRLLACVSL